MRIDSFDYIKPRTVDEALAVLEAHGAAARIMAGGSDLLVRMKLGIASPKFVIGLKHITELNYIDASNGGLKVGAATPLSAIERSAVICERFPALAGAAGAVAAPQIRNAATISGNVCLETMCWYYNQSRQWKKSRPACTKAGGETCYIVNRPDVCYATYRGDTAVALIALGARVKIQSARGERAVLVEELFSGDGRAPLKLGANEMIVEFELPAPSANNGTVYQKIAHRHAVDYPLAGVGVSIDLKPETGICTAARVVLGAVASGPVRAAQAEKTLVGRDISPSLMQEAAEAAEKDAHPVNNMTFGSPSYRRRMIRVLAEKALAAAAAKARE